MRLLPERNLALQVHRPPPSPICRRPPACRDRPKTRTRDGTWARSIMVAHPQDGESEHAHGEQGRIVHPLSPDRPCGRSRRDGPAGQAEALGLVEYSVKASCRERGGQKEWY